MTFEELHAVMTARALDLGFKNIDFLGNLGHSIESVPSDRIYIEPGNSLRLSEIELFTFEPHIKRPGGSYGYKHENIYRFHRGLLTAL